MICRFKIKQDVDLEEAWDLLADCGVNLLYSEEDSCGNKLIYGSILKSVDLPCIEGYEEIELPKIDWQEQWREHGYHFKDGFVHIKMRDLGIKDAIPERWEMLKLSPGPGFGDLSHPTTMLVLKLMAKHLNKQDVLDVGCGSGILSLAAIAMGSHRVVGIDIDPDAIKHAERNRELNGMDSYIAFEASLSGISVPSFVVMNMISSEQIVAWYSLNQFSSCFTQAITSGIPKEEREDYLRLTEGWGMKLQDEFEEEGWLGFYFSVGEQEPLFLPHGQQVP